MLAYALPVCIHPKPISADCTFCGCCCHGTRCIIKAVRWTTYIHKRQLKGIVLSKNIKVLPSTNGETYGRMRHSQAYIRSHKSGRQSPLDKSHS